MTSPFGGFVHTSPLSSLPHDPIITLASNCIRDYFGPTVQTVADGLQRRGGASTLTEIIAYVRTHCQRIWNEERERLVTSLVHKERTSSAIPFSRNGSAKSNGNNSSGKHSGGGGSESGYKIHRAKGPEQAGYVVEAAPIRAALLTLVQHSMVKVEKAPDQTNKQKRKRSSSMITFQYTFLPDRARLLSRYTRYVEYARKALDEYAAAVVEELLTDGRMTAFGAIHNTVEFIVKAHESEEDEEEEEEGKAAEVKGQEKEGGKDDNDSANDDNNVETSSKIDVGKIRRAVVESFVRLAQNGFVELAPPLLPEVQEEENELQDEASPKKQKTIKDEAGSEQQQQEQPCKATGGSNAEKQSSPQEIEILSQLDSLGFHKRFPKNGVWRVNVRMFHDHLRAFCIGRLVAERFGHKVHSAGSIVSAALKFTAHSEHVLNNDTIEDMGLFTPEDIVPYLPGTVREMFEKKQGGAVLNLSRALVQLTEFSWPTVVMEVEEAEGHARGGKFELATRQLVAHLRGRIRHQMVLDAHGEVAARICSILEEQGYQESDAIADSAMIPAKDVREVLHRLYREKCITLLNLQQSKQYNVHNAVYLWGVDMVRTAQTVSDNICTALINIRLRRQHEMDLGKDYIDRAKEAEGTDENVHELDQVNYGKFKQGLERLDNAALQLDETVMVLKDF